MKHQILPQSSSPRQIQICALGLGIGLMLAANFCCAQGTAAGLDKNGHWVGTWGSSPQLTEIKNLPPAPGLASNTLRQVVHVSIGAKKLRLRFSNAFGNGPLTMSAVHIARSAGGSAIKTETDLPLTFHGEATTTIPAGESELSDPVDFDLAPLSDLAVSVHFAAVPSDVTGHPGSRCTSYVQTGDLISASELPAAATTAHWYILTGVDIQTAATGASVITLGDSITDGRGSTTDGNNRWPDDLARRLQANKSTMDIGVLNEGIGGNCVLHGGLGPTALARLDRDVLAQNNARWLIVLEGVNDIGGSRGTNAAAIGQSLIAAFEKIIAAAHAGGLRVYGATITPIQPSFYYTPDHETARQTVNQWIRTSDKFDAVIDLDAAVRDPQKPSQLLPANDSGDHLHPSVAGYETMAAAINLSLFEP